MFQKSNQIEFSNGNMPDERDLGRMSAREDMFVTSRSRAPSLIRVTSLCDDNGSISVREGKFAELPDIIQEAAVSTECEHSFLVSSKIHINFREL